MKLRSLTLITALFLFNAVFAQNPNRSALPAFSSSWGAKVGFAANASYVTDAFINGHELTECTQDTQVGNFTSLILRLNSRTVFLQTGLGLSFTNSCFYIDTNSWDPEAESKNQISCVYDFKSLTLPLQMGYHIVNSPPYCMSAYTGPRLRYTPDKFYKIQYSNVEPYQLTDTPIELIMGWTIGLSVKIGRQLLDFEYEATINTVSGPITDLNGINPAPDYRIDRRLGMMSFSYGILF
jgi:hypothetical protein